MGSHGDVDVILPVLDEAESIGWVLDNLPVGFNAVVVDNGSADASAEIALSHGAKVVFEERRGFGSACWAGLCAAGSEIVCFMDADGSLDPHDLIDVSEVVSTDRANLCLGRRIPEPGAMSVHSKIGNRVVARRVSKRTGLNLRDLGPMRATRREALLALGTEDRRFGWPLEMVLKAAAAGWTIAEVDVTYRARMGGRSKVTGTIGGTIRTVKDMSRMLL